jgi:hypothetical protein
MFFSNLTTLENQHTRDRGVVDPTSQMLREPRLLVPGMQPLGPVKPNYSNPATSLLRSIILPAVDGRLIDIISVTRPTTDTATVRTRSIGRASEYDSTNVTEFAGTPAYRFTSDWSCLIHFNLDAATNYGHLVACSQTITTNGWEIRVGTTATDRNIDLTRMTTDYRSFCSPGPANNLRIGLNVLVIASSASITSTPNTAANGLSFSLSSYGGAGTGNITAGTGNLRFGQRVDGFTKLDGAVFFCALWHRKLSQIECNSLSVDPYQLLIPA